MTRKDFEIIADVISKLGLKNSSVKEFRDAHEVVKHKFANRLALINPRFNKEKFFKACDKEI
jgi:hypothetical protein